MKKVLVTGAAGFIGYHLSKRLLEEGFEVWGIDNLNSYYDTGLKADRIRELGVDEVKNKSADQSYLVPSATSQFSFIKGDLADSGLMNRLFEDGEFEYVLHLGAQAGVRYSLENPQAYIDSNIQGFLNILEGCRNSSPAHLIYASSSSVYGMNEKTPFATSDPVDHPVSLYAATKKSNELMAHTYSHLYGVPTTGLRFFTVYGPWGRPDMAYFLFTDAILKGKPIKVFNHGDMARDFTYIDDIIESIVRLLDKVPLNNSDWDRSNPDPSSSFAPYRLFNIGHNSPVNLMDFIREIEKNLGIEAEKIMLPMQPGDVPITWADVNDLYEMIDYKPAVSIEKGIAEFVNWYKSYYKVTGNS